MKRASVAGITELHPERANMGKSSWIRIAGGVSLALLLTGCSATYPYIPARGQTGPPPQASEAGAPPGAGEAAPPGSASSTPPRPDLAQQVQTLETRVQQLESRLAELEAKGPATAPARPAKSKESAGAGASTAAKTPAAPGYPKTGGAAEKSYSEGLRLYQSKKYGDARAKFHQYLKDAPHGPKVAEARYHLADSFFQEGKYQEAAVEFNKLAGQFPKSILAPAALLRQGLSYKNLNQKSNYQSTMNKLVKAYPQSPEAQEAKKRLKEGR